MSALVNQDRADTAADYHREISRLVESISITKAELRAAVDAADDWVEANKTSYNNALPAAAKANLTAAQKARLLSFVMAKRFAKGA